MPSYEKIDSTDLMKLNLDNEAEFSQVVKDVRRILEIEFEYQTEQWDWTGDLDDAGIFIFSYLLHDYKKKNSVFKTIERKRLYIKPYKAKDDSFT
tara:strand:- start:4502 stop:4786 length:285 start_codon:yes stop_codon:yes gene_type:complete